MSRGPGHIMRAIQRELPPTSAAAGLTASDLAKRVHGPDATKKQVRSVARAARRLVAHDIAASAWTDDGLTAIYYRANAGPESQTRAPEAAPTDALPVELIRRAHEHTRRMINELPNDERQVLTERLTGASMREIAETLGMTTAATEAARQRATAKMRKSWQKSSGRRASNPDEN